MCLGLIQPLKVLRGRNKERILPQDGQNSAWLWWRSWVHGKSTCCASTRSWIQTLCAPLSLLLWTGVDRRLLGFACCQPVQVQWETVSKDQDREHDRAGYRCPRVSGTAYTVCKQYTPTTQTQMGYTQVWKVFQSVVLPPTYCFCSGVLLVHCKAPLIKCEYK